MLYPYTSPQILTDDIFVSYGGATGTSTEFQRQIAYLQSEELVSSYLRTLLVPTVVTGTYPYVRSPVILDYTYLQRIHEIRFLDAKGVNFFTITGVYNYDAAIRDHSRSIIDVFSIYGNYHSYGYHLPYQYQIVYEAGLPTGTSASPFFLSALVTMSDIILNEALNTGGENPGIGITEFSNQDYKEKRRGIINTVLGYSPRVQWVVKLLNGIRKRRGLVL